MCQVADANPSVSALTLTVDCTEQVIIFIDTVIYVPMHRQNTKHYLIIFSVNRYATLLHAEQV